MEPQKPARLESLDALRGFDMLFISGLSTLVIAICTLCGAPEGAIAEQMRHVAWNGLHHHDTIFPLFLFLAGASLPFSIAAQRSRGKGNGAIIFRQLRRLVIFAFIAAAFGGLLNFKFAEVRYLDILTTIGFAGAVSAVLYLYVPKARYRMLIVAAILLGYYLLLTLVPAPDAQQVALPASVEWQGRGPLSLVGNLCGYVDRQWLPGSYYTCCDVNGVGVFDEDGILHNLCAIATAMLGTLAGEAVRGSELSAAAKLRRLGFGATACAILTAAWLPWCPVNMKLWSPTYVLANGAYSFAMFALFYWAIDVKGWRRGLYLFKVVGVNSIAIYILNRTGLMDAIAHWFTGGLASLSAVHGYAEAVSALGLLALNFLVMHFLYQHKIFMKV